MGCYDLMTVSDVVGWDPPVECWFSMRRVPASVSVRVRVRSVCRWSVTVECEGESEGECQGAAVRVRVRMTVSVTVRAPGGVLDLNAAEHVRTLAARKLRVGVPTRGAHHEYRYHSLNNDLVH